jgi:hypothetical protein
MPTPEKANSGHIRAADQDGASRAKARDDRRVALRRQSIVESLRSGQGALARYVEEVLQGNRQSGEWGGDVPGLAQPILRRDWAAQMADESGFPDEGGNFPDRRFKFPARPQKIPCSDA